MRNVSVFVFARYRMSALVATSARMLPNSALLDHSQAWLWREGWRALWELNPLYLGLVLLAHAASSIFRNPPRHPLFLQFQVAGEARVPESASASGLRRQKSAEGRLSRRRLAGFLRLLIAPLVLEVSESSGDLRCQCASTCGCQKM